MKRSVTEVRAVLEAAAGTIRACAVDFPARARILVAAGDLVDAIAREMPVKGSIHAHRLKTHGSCGYEPGPHRQRAE